MTRITACQCTCWFQDEVLYGAQVEPCVYIRTLIREAGREPRAAPRDDQDKMEKGKVSSRNFLLVRLPAFLV